MEIGVSFGKSAFEITRELFTSVLLHKILDGDPVIPVLRLFYRILPARTDDFEST